MRKTVRIYCLILALVLPFVWSCDSLIYDDLSDCPHGVNFNFYRQTPCESGPSYPAAIKQVRVFAFNQQDILVEEYSASGIALSSDYLLETPFYQIGTFSFVAWGGEDLSTYNFSAFTKGKTTKQEMLVSIQKQAENNVTVHPKRVFVGVGDEPLTIEDRTAMGSIFDLVKFNMQELTNRVRFTLHGLSKTDNYSVTITDDNGVYTIAGDYASDAPFNYISPVTRDGDLLKADFTLMKLAENRDTRLTITNTTTGKVEYSVNLVDELIMYKGDSGNPPYRLECDHDFNIVIVFDKVPDDDSTYMIVRVTINDWVVIKRPIILS